jgi:predicted transcriptional regulator
VVCPQHLYHKYSQDSDFFKSHAQDTDVQAEFMRQREHLERTVASIKQKVHKDTSAKQDDVSKIIHVSVMSDGWIYMCASKKHCDHCSK